MPKVVLRFCPIHRCNLQTVSDIPPGKLIKLGSHLLEQETINQEQHILMLIFVTLEKLINISRLLSVAGPNRTSKANFNHLEP